MDTHLTCDIAVTINHKNIVLIQRAKEPFIDKLCLPGGHVDESETPIEAVIREVAEEIGLDVHHEDLSYLLDLDGEEHDPRPGHDRSIVFTIDFPSHDAIATCEAGSDATQMLVRSLDSLMPDELGFDHYNVIKTLRERSKS